MFKVYVLPKVEKVIKRILSKKELNELKYFISNDLRDKGDLVGRHLSYPYLREKKISGKRIYYLVYKEIAIILIIGSSNKKMQKDTICEIKKDLVFYRNFAYGLYKNNKK